jgi:prepilin-type N-terminal cleavage/methylation domain-containing protein
MKTPEMMQWKRRGGFTLTELMIVVAILGILATIAVIAYQRQIRRARLADVSSMFNEIAAKQELFESFNGVYVSTNAFCPGSLDGGAHAVPFNIAGCTGAANWQNLGINAPRQTYFQYSFIAGTPGGTACSPPAGFPEACDSIQAGTHWWVAFARADQDGDNNFARFITSSTMDGNMFQADETE